MNWKREYKEKLLNIEDAVKNIKPNDYIFTGAFGGRPVAIEEELINQRERLKPLTIAQSTIFGHVKLVEPGMEKYFRYISLFSTKDVREAIKEGRAEYVPCFFSEQPEYIEKYFSPTGPPDVACIQVSSPDDSGSNATSTWRFFYSCE